MCENFHQASKIHRVLKMDIVSLVWKRSRRQARVAVTTAKGSTLVCEPVLKVIIHRDALVNDFFFFFFLISSLSLSGLTQPTSVNAAPPVYEAGAVRRLPLMYTSQYATRLSLNGGLFVRASARVSSVPIEVEKKRRGPPNVAASSYDCEDVICNLPRLLNAPPREAAKD